MVLQQESDGLEDEVQQLLDSFIRQGLTLEEIASTLKDIELSIINKGQTKVFEKATLFFTQAIDTRIYNNYSVLKAMFIEDLKELMTCLERTNQHHWIILQVKKFIEDNYQRDIKAAEVAGAHYITPNYFSMLFKQETGYSYSEYLNTIRINKAKQLLAETSNKVFVIAEYVGYRDYKYFVQVFKNNEGVTPTQYRKFHCIKK